MAASRKNQWLRDELILALDLYYREGPNAAQSSLDELSDTLRAIPIEPHLAAADDDAGAPLEQARASLALEHGDLLRDGRGRVGEDVGGRGQRPAARDLAEDSQAADVEHQIKVARGGGAVESAVALRGCCA